MKIWSLPSPWNYSLAAIALVMLWAGFSFSSALTEIAFVFALCAGLVNGFTNRSLKLNSGFHSSYMIPLGLFTLLAIASVFWSEYPRESLRGIFKILQQVLLFVMVPFILRSRRDFALFETVFLIFFTAVILNGFYQYAVGVDFIRGYQAIDSAAGKRVTGSFKTYGLFAAHLIVTIPLMLALGIRYRNKEGAWKRWYLSLPVVLGSVIILVLTRSRGAFLAMAFGLIFLLLYRRQFKGLLLTLLLMGAAVFILPKSMVIHLSGHGKEQSLVERYYLWDRAIQVIRAKPIQGTGINTYAAAHEKYDQKKNWRVRNYYAHNGYLQMAAEIGIPAIVCFIWFLIQYLRMHLKELTAIADPYDRWLTLGIACGCINFIAMAAVDTVLHNEQPVLTFWFLMGLLHAYLQETKNRTMEHAAPPAFT